MTRRELGSATVHALWVATLLCVVAVVMAQVATMVRLKHQVASAADLAALAASRASLVGEDGCDAAREVARRNGARLTRCRMDLDVATVTARQSTPSWWGHRWAFEIDARAAPDFYDTGGASAKSASSSCTAPALSSGSLPLPHFGDCTHDGQPSGHSQATMASRVTRSQRGATA
jgi:secretion/DNA translocation related TadE-like protein